MSCCCSCYATVWSPYVYKPTLATTFYYNYFIAISLVASCPRHWAISTLQFSRIIQRITSPCATCFCTPVLPLFSPPWSYWAYNNWRWAEGLWHLSYIILVLYHYYGDKLNLEKCVRTWNVVKMTCGTLFQDSLWNQDLWIGTIGTQQGDL